MQPTTTSFDATRHRRRSRRVGGALLTSLLLLAACGSGGSDAGPTTTAAPSTTVKAAEAEDGPDESTTTEAEPEDASDRNAMPVDEDDAPSGSWVMVRYQTAQEPTAAEFVPGITDVRLYTIDATCDDEGCDLALAGDGEDGAFNLPGLEEITGEPVLMEAGAEAWVGEEDLEPYGCTDELDGPYVSSHDTRAFSPVRDDGGEIIALVGQVEWATQITAAGEAAGCDMEDTVDRYQTVMVPEEQLDSSLDFEVDGEFVQALNVTDSREYADAMFQLDGQSVTLPKYAYTVEGSCEDDECDVSVSIPLPPRKTIETEMTANEDGTLVVDQTSTAGCSDPDTQEIVFADGAYDITGGITTMVPLLVVDGQASIFLGRLERTSTPTEQGLTHPACSTEQYLEGWAVWIDEELLTDV